MWHLFEHILTLLSFVACFKNSMFLSMPFSETFSPSCSCLDVKNIWNSTASHAVVRRRVHIWDYRTVCACVCVLLLVSDGGLINQLVSCRRVKKKEHIQKNTLMQMCHSDSMSQLGPKKLSRDGLSCQYHWPYPCNPDSHTNTTSARLLKA